MGKKSVLLIFTFSLLTFISSMICTFLIYTNEQNRTEINSKRVLASTNKYKSSTIIYQASNNVDLKSLTPGAEISKTFTITNNNSDKIKYSVIWYNVASTWNTPNEYGITHPEEFVYSLSCTNGEITNNIQMPFNNDNITILDVAELDTNKTNICSLKITFLATGTDQSYNMNKTFNGSYKVIIEE